MKDLRIEFNKNSTGGRLNFPFFCDKIETITFPVHLTDHFNHFIEDHLTISTVVPSFLSASEFEYLKGLTKACTSVHCLNVFSPENSLLFKPNSYNFDLDQVSDTLSMFNFLKCFKFTTFSNDSMQSIKDRFNGDWLTYITPTIYSFGVSNIIQYVVEN